MGRNTVTVDAFARLGAAKKVPALRERTCPVEVIRAVAGDEYPWVQKAVALSPCITEEAAERLSRSKTEEIQRRLAKNPAVPERIRVVALMRADAAA